MKEPRIPLIHRLISTGLGTGYAPIAPGTAGAILATSIWFGYASFTSHTATAYITLALIILFTTLGVKSSTVAESYWGEDPSRVVIDEMVGVWITLLAVDGLNEWAYAFGALLLFRFFDIVKPLGVRKMEKLPSGWGIMADDILAGIYGAIVLLLIKWIIS